MRKNLSEIIDELVTVNLKIFYLIEKIERDDYTKDDAKKVQTLNKQRSALKNAINEFFNERQEVKV